MPSGTRLEVSNEYIARVENVIRSVVKPKDLGMIVSNIGVYPDLSAIYTSNASMDTAFVQTSLNEDHSIGSYEYMRRVQDAISQAVARAHRLLPGRRPGGRRHQSRASSSHRHSGRFGRHEWRIHPGAATGHKDQGHARRERVSISRRTSIIPALRSTSTAKRPASSASAREMLSTT